MISFQEEFSELAPLQSFDAKAFEGDENVPQDVCNLVLALSLAYNDCKDLYYIYLLLKDNKPEGKPKKHRIWGTYFGMSNHILRLHAGFANELLNLIRDSKDAVTHPFFKSVIQAMPREARQAWNSIEKAALEDKATNQLGKFLVLIRNKVSYHYDPDEIQRGYKHCFIDPNKQNQIPLVSLGSSIRDTRFYFSDAAGESYIELLPNRMGLSLTTTQIAEMINATSKSLMYLVGRYLQKRKYSVKDYPEEL